MMRHIRRSATAVAITISTAMAITATLLVSCGQDAEEADKFPSTETSAPLAAGEITTFRLDNGITVYLQEEHSKPEVAVEALYTGGVIHEGADKTQVSRVLPHMLIFSPTASFGPNGAVEKIQEAGRVNGEVTGAFSHFDYTGPGDQLELLLQVEAERLTSVTFNDKQLVQFSKKCQEDLDQILEDPRLSLSKYGLMAFNQAYNYGKTSIPVYNGVFQLTLKDLENFRNARYRLTGMVLAITGDFDTAAATTLINKYFGPIEERPEVTPPVPRPADRNINAHWDVAANVMFLVFPGPYENEVERLVLTMFGAYLNRQLQTNQELARYIKSSFCSNQLYPVHEMPFFVFTEMKRDREPQEIRPAVLLTIDETMRRVNEKMFGAMKTNLISFMESSIFDAQMNISRVPHYQILSQEALNIASRHYLRDGRTTEEFIELVNSITYEQAAGYIESRLTLENMKEVVIREQ
jgi:predicted Zn-dependent peptidase